MPGAVIAVTVRLVAPKLAMEMIMEHVAKRKQGKRGPRRKIALRSQAAPPGVP